MKRIFLLVAALSFLMIQAVSARQAILTGENIALGKPVMSSSIYANQYAAVYATDGSKNTAWGSSTANQPQWIFVDLKAVTEISGLGLFWYDGYHAASYQVYVSDDKVTWSFVTRVDKTNSEPDILPGNVVTRYIGLYCTAKANAAYGLTEFEVYGPDSTPTPTATATPTATSTPTPTATVNPGLSFICTAVEDNLNPEDHYIMIDAFKAMGCQSLGESRNTSVAAMTNFMETNATYLYHTGHGSPGSMRMSDGQFQATMAQIAVENVMIATCWSLKPTTWMTVMGQSSKNVAGYTDWTLDGDVDTAVAEDLADALIAGGSSFAVTWFKVHWPNPWVNSKWIDYARVDGQIVEYSARSNNYPTRNNLVRKAANCLVAPEILNNTTRAAFSTIVKSNEAQVIETGSLDGFAENLRTVSITEDEAVKQAKAQLTIPDDAVYDRAIAILENDTVLGYQVIFKRLIGGLQISSMSRPDQISCYVNNDGKITYTYTYWPGYTNIGQVKVAELTLSKAVEKALPEISALVCGDEVITFVDAFACYGISQKHENLVPAYQLVTNKGEPVVISAIDGSVLK